MTCDDMTCKFMYTWLLVLSYLVIFVFLFSGSSDSERTFSHMKYVLSSRRLKMGKDYIRMEVMACVNRRIVGQILTDTTYQSCREVIESDSDGTGMCCCCIACDVM